MQIVKAINIAVALLFFICYSYQIVYIFVPFFKKRRESNRVWAHRYGVLIAARNEMSVIGQLLHSIDNQTYPRDLIDVFVVADNCTDETAAIARRMGAIVYERFDQTRVGKGFALQFLTKHIRADYGPSYYDAFIVLDADNVLEKNYIVEMNKTFSDGYRIVTSYRNSKNYGSNWISAGYALWFLRESQFLSRSRMLIGSSCVVGGTGFLFSSSILEKKNGWKYFLLTEDIEFSVDNILDGETIGYCETAVLYDEQPETFSQSWNQRLRWAKGFLQVFKKYGLQLFKGIFCKRSFSCFDVMQSIMPAMILSFISFATNLIASAVMAVTGADAGLVLESFFLTFVSTCGLIFVIGCITTITEWRNINCAGWKKILYMFTFPLFMFTYIPIAAVACFKNDVSWTPIRHSVHVELEQLCPQMNTRDVHAVNETTSTDYISAHSGIPESAAHIRPLQNIR